MWKWKDFPVVFWILQKKINEFCLDWKKMDILIWVKASLDYIYQKYLYEYYFIYL